ncbi:unnamed protein product [Cercopithifilaria johnstoni]|uniref:Uncharacterized protein n=1 Tax=Cercopithifilaria johnstoni TaxID=2874296 RepID=A0A8J2Q2R6_9BILA|nr:unnamed protein product [Cercopithifilaria johnstoni]
MNYSIPPSTAEQLLLLPSDSACFTPDTLSISSALSFDNNNYNCDNGEHLSNIIPENGIPKREENMRNDQLAINNAYTMEKTKNENTGVNNWVDDSKSVYSLFETEYDIKTTNRHKFPDWTWATHSGSDLHSKKNKTHASSSFYQLLDMNVEPVDNTIQKLHIPSQYQLEELQNFAPYVDVTYAERTPTVPYLPHTLTRSEYIFDGNGDNAL